jgi:glycosyltransferase involved in cell wall biosynthesis
MIENEPSVRPKLVTIGVPFYKRLDYLPNVLNMVAAQDYPSIELIISDNGQNGMKIREIIEANYRGAYKFRQNPSTVNMSVHFNQIIREASGDYFHLLNDDDEISPNFVSELVGQLELHPEASLAYARLEIINKEGVVVRKSKDNLPVILSGPDFIRATWERCEFNYYNVEGFITRTKLWQQNGGYPVFTSGNHTDNASVIKLCLDHHVAFSSKCVSRHRVHPEGCGWTVSMKAFAADSNDFLLWLDSDPTIQRFAARHFEQWQDLKRALVRMTWETYLWRWRDIYKYRLTTFEWVREAFRMPLLSAYYKKVAFIFWATAKGRVKRLFTHRFEERHDFFQESKSSDVRINGNEGG